MAASWNDVLMKEVASSIADEGRAIYNDAQKRGDYSQYHALTYWTPNINTVSYTHLTLPTILRV